MVKKVLGMNLMTILLVLSMLTSAYFLLESDSMGVSPDEIQKGHSGASYFIKNEGQVSPRDILFYSNDKTIYFTSNSLFIKTIKSKDIIDPNGFASERNNRYREVGVILKYTYPCSNFVLPEGNERCSWNSNYFFGNDPEKWYTNVENYNEIIYKNIWDGIDLIYKLEKGCIKYYLIVKAGADPYHIAFNLEGCSSILKDSSRTLRMKLSGCEFFDDGLKAWNEPSNVNVPVAFNLIDNGYSFKLGSYDNKKTLVIDPLVYSTLIGGSSDDLGLDIAIDSHQNTFFTGMTYSNESTFPTSPGSYDTTFAGLNDVFVSGLNKGGNSLLFSTFIGGASYDRANGIDIDSKGNIYITGSTSNDPTVPYPTTSGAFSTSNMGSSDAFITKLNNNGSSILYSSLIGGQGWDEANDIIVDSIFNAYITGTCESGMVSFPTTQGVVDRTNDIAEAFVSKFNPTGSGLVFSTFIGGDNVESGNTIKIDSTGNIIVGGGMGGNSYQPYFPTTPNVLREEYSGEPGSSDGFVTIINPTATKYLYSTLIGDYYNEEVSDLEIDDKGFIYITGRTTSLNYPTTPGAFDTSFNYGWDIFITKINFNLSSMVFSTFIGGYHYDIGIDIELDGYDVFFSGFSKSDNFPTTKDAFDTSNDYGWEDCVFGKLKYDGSTLIYSTYLGGSRSDFITDMQVDLCENVYLIGYSDTGFPTTKGAFDESENGGFDTFIWRFSYDDTPPEISDKTPSNGFTGDEFEFLLNVSDPNDVSLVSVEYWFGINKHQNITIDIKDVFSKKIMIPDSLVNLNYFFHAKDLIGNWNATKKRTVPILDNDLPVIDDISSNIGICGNSFKFTASIRDNIKLNSTEIKYWSDSGFQGNGAMGNGISCFLEILVPLNSTSPIFYEIQATDSSENINKTSPRKILIFDRTPPSFQKDQTIKRVGTGDSLTFKANVSDNIGVREVYVEYSFGQKEHYNFSMIRSNGFIYNVSIPIDSLDEVFYRFSAKDLNSNWAFQTGSCIVFDSIAPKANAGVDDTVPEDKPIILDGSLSTDNIAIKNWTWSIIEEGSNIFLYGLKVNYTFTQPGKYDIILNVSDAAHAFSIDNMTINVKDVTPPEISVKDWIIDEDKIFYFDGYTFTDNVIIKNISWSFNDKGDKITIFGTRPHYFFSDPGVLTVKVKATDEEGNNKERQFNITVKDITSPSVDAGDNRTIYNMTRIYLNGTGSDNVGIVNWTWSFKEGSTFVTLYGSKVIYAFLEPENYTLILTVKDLAGNTNTDSIWVKVNAKPHSNGEGDKKEDEKEEKTPMTTLVFIIVALILFLILLVSSSIFIFLKRKKGKVKVEGISEVVDEGKLEEAKAQSSTTVQETVIETKESTQPVNDMISENIFDKVERLRGVARSKSIDIHSFEMQYIIALSMSKNPSMADMGKKHMEVYSTNIEKILPK